VDQQTQDDVVAEISKLRPEVFGQAGTSTTPAPQESTPHAADSGLPPTLFDKIGGADGMRLLVDFFYTKVLADSRINTYFSTISMPTLKQHQRQFLTLALGGWTDYDGKGMREAHAPLKIAAAQFDAMVEDLVLALTDLRVPDVTRDSIVAIVGSLRGDVLGSAAGAKAGAAVASAGASAVGDDATLFEKLGGDEVIENIVVDLSQFVAEDPLLRPVFNGVNMGRLVAHQRRLLATLTGGPGHYVGQNMRRAHARLKVTGDQFDAWLRHFEQAVEEAAVKPTAKAELVSRVKALRSDVLNEAPVKTSVYDRLGGSSGVEALVEMLHSRIGADVRIRHLFDGMNETLLKLHQRRFLSRAFGGESTYGGRDMRSAHAKLKLSPEHFDAWAEDLMEALAQLKADDDLQDEVLVVIEENRSEVLGL